MTRDELARWWRSFGETECRGYSPLYEQVCTAVADRGAVLDRLLALPAHAQQPNMLLAAVHDLVLRGGAPALAERYDARRVDDVGQVFVEVALDAWHDLVPVLEVRRTQTNEVGRVATLAPAFAAATGEQPATVVDVGTSAGLTLLVDRYRIDYGALGRLGPPDSPVQVTCTVHHGNPPIRATPVARRVGLDRSPLDVTDPDDARWLVACTWPDTDRLERTRAAVALAAAHPGDVRVGDAVADLPDLLAEIDGPVIVTTTWVVAYFPDATRRAFSDVLAAASTHRSVRWISAEAPGVVEALPHHDAPEVDGASASVLGLVHFEGGRPVRAQVLAHTHPHGSWLWWYDDPPTVSNRSR